MICLICVVEVTHGLFLWVFLGGGHVVEAAQLAKDNGNLSINEKELFARAGQIPDMIDEGKLKPEQIPNPHWHKEACITCHKGEPERGKESLRFRNISHGCNTCHQYLAPHTSVHPTQAVAPRNMQARMPEAFRKTLGKDSKETTCDTCHEPIIQCTKKQSSAQWRNKAFLRGGPYSNRTDMCFQCHDKGGYGKLNPHDQINSEGDVNKDKCLLCHREMPVQSEHVSASKTELHLKSDLAELCLNCHKKVPHPGGNMAIFSKGKPPEHLVVPNEWISKQMVLMSRENNVTLPLEPGTGAIYCATCHDPHEKGIIKEKSAVRGAGEKNRLRLNKICTHCHKR